MMELFRIKNIYRISVLSSKLMSLEVLKTVNYLKKKVFTVTNRGIVPM